MNLYVSRDIARPEILAEVIDFLQVDKWEGWTAVSDSGLSDRFQKHKWIQDVLRHLSVELKHILDRNHFLFEPGVIQCLFSCRSH